MESHFLLAQMLVLLKLGIAVAICEPTSTGTGYDDDIVLHSQAPEQIHLSLGDTYNEMQVLWATADSVASWVAFWEDGKEEEEDQRKTHGEVVRLTKHNEMAKQFIHRAVLKNLTEGVTYTYIVQAKYGTTIFNSSIYNFTTFSKTKTHPHQYLIYGDLGLGNNTGYTGDETVLVLADEVRTGNYSAVWHVGDISYCLWDDWGAKGDEFLRRIEQFAAWVPFMVTPGNHEREDNDFHQYTRRFATPNTAWPIPIDHMFYSTDIGLVHFISYSSEAYFQDWLFWSHWQQFECTQYYWLLEDLMRANDNRDKVPWIIALGHRPMYCTNTGGDDCRVDLLFRGRIRDGLEALFHAQGVDLIIEAHEHSYERLWPVLNGDVIQKDYVNPRGSVHVVTGAAGNPYAYSAQEPATEPWDAFRHATPQEHNYGRLHVANATHLQWQQVTVNESEVIDSFWLVQERHGPFVDTEQADCREHSGWTTFPSICACPLPLLFWIALYSTLLLLGIVLVVVVAVVICKRRTKLRRIVCCPLRCCCGRCSPRRFRYYRALKNTSDHSGDDLLSEQFQFSKMLKHANDESIDVLS